MKTNIKEWTANTLKSEQKVNSRDVQTLFPCTVKTCLKQQFLVFFLSGGLRQAYCIKTYVRSFINSLLASVFTQFPQIIFEIHVCSF